MFTGVHCSYCIYACISLHLFFWFLRFGFDIWLRFMVKVIRDRRMRVSALLLRLFWSLVWSPFSEKVGLFLVSLGTWLIQRRTFCCLASPFARILLRVVQSYQPRYAVDNFFRRINLRGGVIFLKWVRVESVCKYWAENVIHPIAKLYSFSGKHSSWICFMIDASWQGFCYHRIWAQHGELLKTFIWDSDM